MKNSFMSIYKIIGHKVVLSYPNFSERIILRTDSIKMQPWMVINRKWDFCCLLLTQVNHHLIDYTNTERKLFPIVETLKGK